MKISPPPSPNSQVVEPSKGTDRTPQGRPIEQDARLKMPSEAGPSSVEISDGARLMQKARELAHTFPASRADRVSALKKSIQDGTYKVDAEALAEKILDEHLASDFGKNNL